MRKVVGTVGILLFLWASLQPVRADSPSPASYLPQAAEEAINKSQRQLVVRFPKISGKEFFRQSSAFLINKEGWVVAALHGLPEDIDILMAKEGRITFGGLPAKFYAALIEMDLAILKLEKIPEDLSPAVLAKEVQLFTPVFAKLSGTFDFEVNGGRGNGKKFIKFTGLPFRAVLVGRTSLYKKLSSEAEKILDYLWLDQSAKEGFSGAMFVNDQGEVVGMGIFTDGGFTGVLSVSDIRAAIEIVKKRSREKQEDQAVK